MSARDSWKKAAANMVAHWKQTGPTVAEAEAYLREMHAAGNVDDILEAAAHLERVKHADGVEGGGDA